ncbi:MAG: hypothetical protein E7379_01815 [Clostridiales bacterium]|nr:hypothetical protein [Clostridiales bacterium]
MKIDFKEKFKALFERIKKIKHLYIYLALSLALLSICVYFVALPSQKDSNKEETIDNNRTEFSTSAEYVVYLENKLESVINCLKGVENVEVAITLEKGFEYVYQTEDETRTTSNGTSITTTTLVYIDGKPVMLEEIYPVIKGIVVVVQGSEEVSVKLNIIQVIKTMIDVDSSQINIIN